MLFGDRRGEEFILGKEDCTQKEHHSKGTEENKPGTFKEQAGKCMWDLSRRYSWESQEALPKCFSFIVNEMRNHEGQEALHKMNLQS